MEYQDRKSTRLNSSHLVISYAVFCLKKKRRGESSRGRTGPAARPGGRGVRGGAVRDRVSAGEAPDRRELKRHRVVEVCFFLLAGRRPPNSPFFPPRPPSR